MFAVDAALRSVANMRYGPTKSFTGLNGVDDVSVQDREPRIRLAGGLRKGLGLQEILEQGFSATMSSGCWEERSHRLGMSDH